jgi:hypothetical protein
MLHKRCILQSMFPNAIDTTLVRPCAYDTRENNRRHVATLARVAASGANQGGQGNVRASWATLGEQAYAAPGTPGGEGGLRGAAYGKGVQAASEAGDEPAGGIHGAAEGKEDGRSHRPAH